MVRALSIRISNCTSWSALPGPAKSKSPGSPLKASIGILVLLHIATTPIPCNPHEISRGLHGIGWAGPPSHLSGGRFSRQAIEPLRRRFFREFACAFYVSLGRHVQADLADTFALLLMSTSEIFRLLAAGRAGPGVSEQWTRFAGYSELMF